jgi:LacI family transcriptional regulator
LTPSLTTISQHGVEIGEVAAKLLIDRLESKEENLPMKQLSLKQN